ncbi:MAG: hypothetical protein IKH45_04730 [Neisseriaceae bacterium]|nr:hypothetical protein [Neisseriaceae bacterium]
MLYNKTNKSVFSVLCITAMIALSLTACKKNSEKQNAVEEQHPVVQQNNAKNNKQPENKQAMSKNQEKTENEYPIKDIKEGLRYQNEAKQIVLMLDYCFKNRSPEICENIADIYNGGIVNGKIKIANNTKEKIKQQFNLNVDEEFKVYEKTKQKIKEIEKKQKEGLISKNEEYKLKEMVKKNTREQGYIANYRELEEYERFLEEIEKRLESKKNDAMEASRRNWPNASAEWETYHERIESLDAEDKIKETIFKLYFLACSDSYSNWRSNIVNFSWRTIEPHGSTTACHKAISSLNSVAFRTIGYPVTRVKIKNSDYLDIYGGICRSKKISNACILAGDTVFNQEIMGDMKYGAAYDFYNLADEKTPEVEERIAFIQQVSRYLSRGNGECSAYRDYHHLDSLAKLTRVGTEPKDRMNHIWNIIKSDTCIAIDENKNLFFENVANIKQKQQQKQQEKEEFLKSINAPIN